jgi:hypothetical protein
MLLIHLLSLLSLISILPITLASSTPSSSPPIIYIEWHYPVWSGGGYSSEGTSYLLALSTFLSNSPHLVSLRHHGDGINHSFMSSLPSDQAKTLMSLSQVNPDPTEYHYKVVVCHSEPGAWNVLGGPSWSTSLCPPPGSADDPKVITVGRTMFETDRLPEGWAGRINNMDEVWVPTPFHAEIFSSGGVKIPISTLIETVDTDFFDPDIPSPDPLSSYGLSPSTFKFLSVFKFEDRKGYDVLLSSYFATFTRGEDVALFILVSDYHSRGGREDLEVRGRGCGERATTLFAPFNFLTPFLLRLTVFLRVPRLRPLYLAPNIRPPLLIPSLPPRSLRLL